MSNKDQTITMPITQEEKRLIEIIRSYTASFADFKVEMREGKITRVLPTFSELITPLKVVKKQ